MKLSEFNQLNEFRQTCIVKQHGVLLTNRTESGTTVFLYQVDSFYIELFHDMEHVMHNSLRILRTFEDVDKLEDYLGKSDIPLPFSQFFLS